MNIQTDKKHTSIRIVNVGRYKYKQRVRYEWDTVRKRGVTTVIEHLGPVKPLAKRRKRIALSLGGIQSVFSAGHLALFYSVIKQFRLKETLNKVCPSDGGQTSLLLLTLILNQLNGRRSLTKIGSWMDYNPLKQWIGDVGPVTKDTLASSLDVIYSRGPDVSIRRVDAIQNEAMKSWQEVVGRDPMHHFLYYDVCRIRYNGEHCEWAEYGHGDTPDRPHVGIGLVTGKRHHFPYLSLPIKGSMHDAPTLKDVERELEHRGIKNVTLIVDRAFLSKETAKRTREIGFKILGGCRDNSNDVKAALRKFSDEEIERPGQVVRRATGNGVLYYRGWKGKLFGAYGQIVVTLDPYRRMEERGARDIVLAELHSRKGRNLEDIREVLGKIVIKSKGRRGWKVNDDIEAEERHADGRFLLFTTDMALTPEEMVSGYFQRDDIEKAFRELKGPTSMGPIRYRLWNRVDAYLNVVCYFSYLIRAGIRWRLTQSKRTESVDEVIDILRGVYCIRDVVEGIKYERWGPLTKEAKDLIGDLELGDFIPTTK
jgi:hypothetical protein